MKINKEITISTSNDSRNESDIINTNLIEDDNDKDKINNIKSILSKNKLTKQKEENASEELIEMINKEKINIIKLKDQDNYTIIQRFCLDKEIYFLKCIFLCLEKLLNDQELNEYLLYDKNSFSVNIFEISSEIGDLGIFRILKKYLLKNIAILKHLINNNIDGKKNIFHIAASKNQIISLLFFYSFYYNNNIHISILDIKDNFGHTPLHIACTLGFYNFVQYLINLGVNMNDLDKDNKTALFFAVESKSVQIVKYLIINGADKYIKDKIGKIAKDYTKDNNIIDILEDKSWSDIACKFKTQFGNLKNHHRNIVMIVLLIFLSIFHCYILIKYKISGFLQNCNYDMEFKFDFVFLIVNIAFEFLGLLMYIIFQITKIKKVNNNNSIYANKFCINENGIEFYEMFKYNENICMVCKRVKETSTKHCISCDTCIDEFDHHCFFLNACIHRKNKIGFRLFVVIMVSALILNIALSIIFFIDMINEPKIYYGLGLADCNFNKEKLIIIDYIILFVDAIYFLLCFYTILVMVIPTIIYFVKKNRSKTNGLQEKINSPLLPIEENNV